MTYHSNGFSVSIHGPAAFKSSRKILREKKESLCSSQTFCGIRLGIAPFEALYVILKHVVLHPHGGKIKRILKSNKLLNRKEHDITVNNLRENKPKH